MAYDPLPEYEQVKKHKKLPDWWNKIDSIPYEEGMRKSTRSSNEYTGLPGTKAVLCCLKNAGKAMRFQQIVNALDRQETSIFQWTHQLLASGQITYEEHHHTRYWRLLKPGEKPAAPLPSGRYRPVQQQLLTMLESQPERGFTPKELQLLIGSVQISGVIRSLLSLVRTGDVERQFDATLISKRPRCHPYRYRLSTIS